MTPQPDLSHIRFIGGATDAGKTTVAALLAEQYGLQVYHYDKTDLAHHQGLAESDAEIAALMAASMDERWLLPSPQVLTARALRSFDLRFPLVLEDLLALPPEPPITAEGFGLTPDLVVPLLAEPNQAIWLIPTEDFKRESMRRRGKPSFGNQVSDPQQAAQNLLARDLLLAEEITAQAQRYDCRVIGVDGSQTAEETASIVGQHFGLEA